MEFLIHMAMAHIDVGSNKENELREREALRARELTKEGVLIRLWRVPGRRENWGIWTAESTEQLHGALISLPLFPYLTITVHALATHPNDPAHFNQPVNP